MSGWLQGLESMYAADIRAIPEEKWSATFGGCTRSAAEVTSDALSLLEWTTEAIKGNIIETYEFTDEMKQACSTKDGATARLQSATKAFSAALAEASDERLNTTVTPPWQMDAPVFMLAQIAVSHLWYHDGQLNYIQALLGDDKVHWMEQ